MYQSDRCGIATEKTTWKDKEMILKNIFKITNIAFVMLLASINAKADDPKSLTEIKPLFNQDYIPFAKEWMKTSSTNKVFQFLGALTGADSQAYSIETLDEISRTFNAPASNVVQTASQTFAEYCTFHNQTVLKFKNELYCLKPNGIASARIKWSIDEAMRRDGGGSYSRFNVTFLHQSNSAANKAYHLLSSYSVGDDIKTKFGSAMIIERKDGGLFQVQLSNGTSRWISTDDIVLQ